MSGHQTATIEDTVYFWFAANDTSGSGGDGATPLFDVREAGAAAGAIPLLGGTPTLLSHANYPAGCHEIAVAATVANGFAENDTFAVFCTLLVDSQNPSGFVGSCTLTPLATRAQVDGIGTAGGAAVNTDANTSNEGGGISGVTSGTTIVGTPTNTYTATSILDGTYHIMTHAANAIDIVYQFLTGGGTEPVAVVWTGYLTSANDTLTMSAWNHVGAAWEVVGSIPGTGGTSNSVINPILFPRHRGTSVAEFGKVYIRLHATGQTSPVLNTDQLYVQFSVTSRTTGYDGGQIWIDTTHGTPGTEDYVNGVADFKSDSLGDAITLGASVGLEAFNVSPESTITFGESHTDEIWKGEGWTLALGGQDISQSHIYHCNDISGIGTSPSGEVHVLDSHIGATTLGVSHITNCSFKSTFTAGAAGDYFIENSRSGVAGSGNPTMTFTGLGAASNINIRGWMGGGTWAFDSNCTASIEVFMGGTHTITTGGGDIEFRGAPKNLEIVTSGAGTTNIIVWSGAPIAISGTGGTVNIYGLHNGITDTSTGTTVTDFGANILDLSAVLVDTGTTIPALLPAALVGGKMDSNVSAIAGVAQSATNLEASTDTLLIGTASGTPSTTAMVSDISVTVDDQFKGRTIIFASDTATAALQNQATDITACTASSNTLTFTALTTAPSSGDVFVVV